MSILKSSRVLGFAFVFILAAAGLRAQGAEPKYTIEAEGEGPTRYLAIIDAVKQALMQTEGVNVVAIDQIKNEATSRFSSRDGSEQSSSNMEDKFKRDISSSTSGRIAGYEVISASKSETNTWTAVISATLNKYNTPGLSPDSRRKLAVLPFRIHEGGYKLDGATLKGPAISERLGQRLVTGFTQSRKFAVVDRDYTDEYLKEVGFLKSDNVPTSELIKIGQALGVDYLIVGTIEEFAGKIETVQQTMTNRTLSSYQGSAIVSYRILVMATRQIKWSDTIRLNLANVGGDSLDTRFDNAITEVAWHIGNQALENIYPIKVVDAYEDTGEVILGRGGNMMQPGERFTIMRASEKVIVDPDTGEPLGRRETPSAIVEIVRVEAKMSYARIVQGKATAIKVGDIVRRSVEPPPAQQPVKPTVVKLPGDR